MQVRSTIFGWVKSSGGWDGPKRLASVLLGRGAGDVRRQNAGQDLNVEDFFNSRAEFQMGGDGTATQINHPKPAAQLFAIGHDGNSFQRRPGFGETHKGMPA